MDRGTLTGLLEPYVSQIWVSVREWERIHGVGSCALDLGSGVGSYYSSVVLSPNNCKPSMRPVDSRIIKVEMAAIVGSI